jgi:hypothetical protein
MTDQSPDRTPPAPRPRRDAPKANPAEIRNDIDTGETGDKTPGADPAAAPLGTDEEAAGPMLSGADQGVVRADQRLGRPEVRTPNAAEPELAPAAEQPPQARNYTIAVVIGVLAAVALAVLIYLAM